jgi:hypothetical protein
MAISGQPIAAAPIAAAASAGPIELVVLENLAAADVGIPDVTVPIYQALTAGAAIDPEVLPNLIASLSLASAVQSTFHLAGTASDSAAVMDSAIAAWQLLIDEEVATLGAALGTVRKVAALADAMAATGLVVGNLTAFAAIVQAITMEGLIAQGFQPNLVDDLILTEATTNTAKMLGSAMDALMASDAALPMLRISAVAADGLEFDGAPEALLRANADLADGVVVYVTLRLGDTDYVGWVLNTDALAASQYRTAPFDSYASFKGKDYAAGPDGLVQLTGKTDDGAAIEWSLKTFLMDFGTSKFNRVPACYIGATSSGTLVVKVITRDPGTGVQSEDWYTVARAPASGPGTGYAKLGRGLKSTWWGFELVPKAGADLDGLDSIALRPLILERRV